MRPAAGPAPATAAGATGPPDRATQRSRQTVWLAAGLGLLMAALAGAFVAYEAVEVRRSQLLRVALYARTLDDNATQVVNGAEAVMRSLLGPLAQVGGASGLPALSPLLADQVRDRAVLRSLSLLDERGQVLASSNADNLGLVIDLAALGGAAPGPDRSARLGPPQAGRDLRQLRPLQAGPSTDAPVYALPMLMPVQAGGQQVWLLALLNPDRIANQFERTLESTALQALLLTLDGQLIIASQGVALPSGTPLRHLPAFSRHLPAREFASEVGPGSSGAAVTSAFRLSRQWPLVVQVEQSQQEFHSRLLSSASGAGALLLAAWALLAAGSWTLRRALQRDERLAADLRRAHAATKASESRKLAILHSALDAILSIDSQGRIIDFNRAAELMFGRSAADVLGLPMHALIVPPHLQEAHRAGMARYQATGQARVLNRRIEVPAQRADGSLFPVELTIMPVRTAEGELFTATLRDITERQRVETALRDSEARAQATFEQAAVGVLQQAPDRRLLRVNQTLCQLLGYTRDELLALPPERLVHPDDQAAGQEGLRRLFAGEIGNFVQDKRYRQRSGAYLWVRLTASVARGPDEQPLYLIGIVEDISARRRAEEDLDAARQRELQIGARIQQSLLVTTPPPEIAGLHISCHSQASQGVDGDFLELIRIGPHCVDLITGDVMGKGLAAAMMGAATRLQFSRSIAELVAAGAATGRPPRPADVVAAVHRAMTPALQGLDAFVTLCYLRIDTAKDTVTWVGCGHEETLLVRPGQAPLALANQHPPLGVLDEAGFEQQQLPLHPGDALFLCSDGITDALRADGQRVGRDRLLAAVAARLQQPVPPAAQLHGLRRDLLGEGVQVQDDLTLVVLQRPPPGGQHTRIELPVRLSALGRVREFVARQAADAGLDEAAAGLLTVACVEAFTNVVRHADGLLPQAPIELLACRQPQQLAIDLVYLGDPYTPPADPGETDFSAYPEGGFGLQIIHGASDEACYSHADGINTLRLVKRLAPAT